MFLLNLQRKENQTNGQIRVKSKKAKLNKAILPQSQG